MLNRIWERLGIVERKPAEIYRFDQHADTRVDGHPGAPGIGDGGDGPAPRPVTGVDATTPEARRSADALDAFDAGTTRRTPFDPVPVDATPLDESIDDTSLLVTPLVATPLSERPLPEVPRSAPPAGSGPARHATAAAPAREAADVLPFAPAAARAAARRDETSEWFWAAAAVVTVAGAALVARVYRDRRMRTQ